MTHSHDAIQRRDRGPAVIRWGEVAAHRCEEMGTALSDTRSGHVRRTNSRTSDESVIAAASDGAYTLIVADFADAEAAWGAYEALKAVEDGRAVAIEGVVVGKRGQDGKLENQKATDHSTRSGLRWGLVGGIALGVIFPPSSLGGAAALGAAGAATGKVRQMHTAASSPMSWSSEVAAGHSGIDALVSDPGVVEIRKALAEAEAIVRVGDRRRRGP